MACAVAVGAVVFYHVQMPGVRGGFLGVDVFFVISGCLITALLLRDAAAGTFSIIDFYERRARRILPALLLVVGAASILAVAILPPTQLYVFSQSVFAVSVFASNIFFFLRTDYFADATAVFPLLHPGALRSKSSST